MRLLRNCDFILLLKVECGRGPDSDKPGFASWVKELKQEFRLHGLLLSAAVSPSKQVIDKGQPGLSMKPEDK